MFDHFPLYFVFNVYIARVSKLLQGIDVAYVYEYSFYGSGLRVIKM